MTDADPLVAVRSWFTGVCAGAGVVVAVVVAYAVGAWPLVALGPVASGLTAAYVNARTRFSADVRYSVAVAAIGVGLLWLALIILAVVAIPEGYDTF